MSKKGETSETSQTRDGGYRDETASLVAENARLRGELVRIRRPRRRLGLAAVLVALDAAATLGLRPWFNGASDAKFWAACAIVSFIAFFAAAVAFGAFGALGAGKEE